MSNGSSPLPSFALERLSYGDLRRLQSLDPTTPDGLTMLDSILDRAVVGGLDAIPVTAITQTVAALTAAITEAMSGPAGPAALSSPALDAAKPEATPT